MWRESDSPCPRSPVWTSVREAQAPSAQHIAACCNAVHHVATQYNMLRRSTTCCDAVQHVATRYTMLQRSTTCCKRSTTCPCSHSPMRTSAREAQPAYARLRNDRSAGYHAAEIDVKVEGYHVRRIPCSISHGWRVKAGSVTVVTAFCTVWN